MRRNPVRFAGCRCRAGHGPAPTMARRNHSGAFDVGGPVLAEHINVFPTGLLPPTACIRQTGPVYTRNSGNTPTNAPHPVGAAAMPGPFCTRNSGDVPTDTLHRVGNAFMRSEACPFAPEPGTFCGLSLPGPQSRGCPNRYAAPCREHIYVFRSLPLCAGNRCVLRAVAAGPGMARPLQWPGGTILVHSMWAGRCWRNISICSLQGFCRRRHASDKPARHGPFYLYARGRWDSTKVFGVEIDLYAGKKRGILG